MSQYLTNLKNAAQNIPASYGTILSNAPFGLRLGLNYYKTYFRANSEKRKLKNIDHDLLFNRLKRLLNKSLEIEFYREHYKKNGFKPGQFKSLENWRDVPVVTKSDFREYDIYKRSIAQKGSFRVNTGGTSGSPLEFFLDKRAFAREWAHMHLLWESHGYRKNHIKITFRGKSFGTRFPLKYNAVHNEFVVNASSPMELVVNEIISISSKYSIRWVHGYPSLISEFANTFFDIKPDELLNFRANLYGVLLGSEFPADIYRHSIQNLLSNNICCWYGHSEMAILAYETSYGVYQAFPSYGFAEALADDRSNSSRLVVTSFQNFCHPFIKYDTGDLVEPLSKPFQPLVFRVSEGRVGEFILDRFGKKHSLTAIIFGRHHSAFDSISHIQIRQIADGYAEVLITPLSRTSLNLDSVSQGFDFSNIPIDFVFKFIEKPIRTSAGKIRLKVD